MANCYNVTVLQRMLFDELAVDVRAVGAVQIFEERVIENRDDRRVLTTDSQVVHLDVIFRLASDQQAFFLERKIAEDRLIKGEY
jgi:hypothetical protein